MQQSITITSTAFRDGESIPIKYTSDGENINPPLLFGGIAESIAALTLIVDDPDAATDPDGPGHTFDHWVVFNIPPDTIEIAENSVPYRAIEARNGAGQSKYIGPAPPNGEHRYFFKLYALSSTLDLGAEATKSQVEKAMDGKVVAQAQLIGKYQRSRR